MSSRELLARIRVSITAESTHKFSFIYEGVCSPTTETEVLSFFLFYVLHKFLLFYNSLNKTLILISFIYSFESLQEILKFKTFGVDFNVVYIWE